MRLIKPTFKILSIPTPHDSTQKDAIKSPLDLIEFAGRVCYKSDNKKTPTSSKDFVKKLRILGHESVLEHSSMSVHFVVDRGVSHEIVRHRHCAFSQESTRFCNYRGGVTFIIPSWLDFEEGEYLSYKKGSYATKGRYAWFRSMEVAEDNYLFLLEQGWTPQQARSVLPNSLKTELVVTTNFREWRHIFKLRCSKASHPQMRETMIPLLKESKELIPIIFDDIEVD